MHARDDHGHLGAWCSRRTDRERDLVTEKRRHGLHAVDDGRVVFILDSAPVSFLTVGYDSNTNQSLKQAGEQADSLFYVYDGAGNTIGNPRLTFPDTTGFAAKGHNVGAREELTPSRH